MREHAVTPYHCTVQLSPDGPQVGMLIDDPDAPGWRGDFAGEPPSDFSTPAQDGVGVGDGDGMTPTEGRRVTVTIVTGDRSQQSATATLDGDGGRAWLTGLEPFTRTPQGPSRDGPHDSPGVAR